MSCGINFWICASVLFSETVLNKLLQLYHMIFNILTSWPTQMQFSLRLHDKRSPTAS